MIWTSYFNKVGQFSKDRFLRIGIARVAPTWAYLDVPKLRYIAPSSELLTGIKTNSITKDEYKTRYLSSLDTVGFGTYLHLFNTLESHMKKELVLFCYESPEKFCHRHLFADWFNQCAGKVMIKEFEW